MSRCWGPGPGDNRGFAHTTGSNPGVVPHRDRTPDCERFKDARLGSYPEREIKTGSLRVPVLIVGGTNSLSTPVPPRPHLTARRTSFGYLGSRRGPVLGHGPNPRCEGSVSTTVQGEPDRWTTSRFGTGSVVRRLKFLRGPVGPTLGTGEGPACRRAATQVSPP